MDQVFTYEAFAHATAGMCGGQAAMSTFYPLDVIRTYMQVNENLKGKSTLQVAQAMIEEEGVGSMYKGIGPVLISLAASNFIYFYTNNMLKVMAKSYTGQRNVTTGQNLLIASIAGCVNVMTTCPLWVVSARLKTQKDKISTGSVKPYKGFIDGLYRVASEEGVSSLWNGCMASLVLVSNPTIQFVCYDWIKKIVEKRVHAQGRKSLSSFEFFTLGAFAKAVATIVTYPVQVAQSKLRNSNKNMKVDDEKTSGIRKYNNTLDCLVKIFHEDGFFGWYKGLNVKLLQTVLMAAFHFLCYESIVGLIFSLLKKQKHAAAAAH
jgi:adenine nucleotide transporter 17